MDSIPTKDRIPIRRKLLAWYDRNKRDLPWRRRRRDPYAQWVAEIMLQQTRVETVLRYYDPFLAQFPNVEALARARHEAVLKAWEGLGYYRRALHLHKAARELTAARSDLPTTASSLRTMQGIGEYTAAAIASIAYDEPAAAVDGNVARVISRLIGLADTTSTGARRQIQFEADRLLSRNRPGDFNQAWMDLGSSVCLPRSPNCERCPLRNHCMTGSNGGRLPGTKSPPKVESLNVLVALIESENRLLMRRRPVGGLWSGLWEFPSLDGEWRDVSSGFRTLAENHQLNIPDRPKRLGLVRHELTHRRIRFHVYTVQLDGSAGRRRSARWVTEEAIKRLPVSTAHRRIHRLWLDRRLGEGTG